MEGAVSMWRTWQGGAHQAEWQNIVEEVTFDCVSKAGKNFHMEGWPEREGLC